MPLLAGALVRPAAARRVAVVGARAISSEHLALINATLPAVAEAGTKFTDHFYGRMLTQHPELRNVFNQSNQRQGRQSKALFSSIAASATTVLETGDLPHELLEAVHHKHCALNVQPEQYAIVGENIIGTIVDLLDPPQEVLDAWGALYGDLATACVDRSEELYAAAEAAPGGWRGTREFKVKRKTLLSSTVVEFDFEPVDGGPISSHIPGQYTTVHAPAGPAIGEFAQPRHYTLVPSPDEGCYSIAVKREEAGQVSKWLHDDVLEGDVVSLSPPFGDFHIAHAEKKWLNDADAPIVLISGGVGITPTLSMLSSVQAGKRPVVWLHAAENSLEHPFKEYLRGLGRALDEENKFTRRVWYRSPLPGDHDRIGTTDTDLYHFEGLMDLSKVKSDLHLGNDHVMYFFCGPKGFMQAVAGQLTDYGVPPARLAFESFGPAEDVLP